MSRSRLGLPLSGRKRREEQDGDAPSEYARQASSSRLVHAAMTDAASVEAVLGLGAVDAPWASISGGPIGEPNSYYHHKTPPFAACYAYYTHTSRLDEGQPVFE